MISYSCIYSKNISDNTYFSFSSLSLGLEQSSVSSFRLATPSQILVNSIQQRKSTTIKYLLQYRFSKPNQAFGKNSTFIGSWSNVAITPRGLLALASFPSILRTWFPLQKVQSKYAAKTRTALDSCKGNKNVHIKITIRA